MLWTSTLATVEHPTVRLLLLISLLVIFCLCWFASVWCSDFYSFRWFHGFMICLVSWFIISCLLLIFVMPSVDFIASIQPFMDDFNLVMVSIDCWLLVDLYWFRWLRSFIAMLGFLLLLTDCCLIPLHAFMFNLCRFATNWFLCLWFHCACYAPGFIALCSFATNWFYAPNFIVPAMKLVSLPAFMVSLPYALLPYHPCWFMVGLCPFLYFMGTFWFCCLMPYSYMPLICPCYG